MFFAQGRTPRRKLHTITGLLRQKQFEGAFEFAGKSYSFVYAPAKAEIANGKLHLIGRFTVRGSGGRSASVESLRSTLAAIQGATGAGPQRPNRGESIARFEAQRSRPMSAGLPVVEGTDALSSTGVMYFHFEPIKTPLLVPADLTRVQFNARLAPIDSTARTIHGIYCSIIDAHLGRQADAEAAAAFVAELNKQLGAA